MATVVRYGTVELHNVLTREWTQTVEYDPSRTDATFTRFSLRFDGVIHANGLGSSGFQGTSVPTWINKAVFGKGTTAASIYQDVISALSAPRLNLLITFQDPNKSETLLQVFPTDATSIESPDRDVDNGPKPKLFSINHIGGQSSFRVSWGVDCAKVFRLQTSNASKVPFILNNRWSVDEDMDGDFKISRTITGRMRLSVPVSMMDLETMKQLKVVCVPGLERGFKRDRVQFSSDVSGLECNYTIVDRQVHNAAPWPATKMDATHSEATTDGSGVNYVSEMNVRLTGRLDVDKRLLITRAIQIIDSRLHFIDKMIKAANATSGSDEGNHKAYLLDSASIVDHIGEESIVEARVRLRWMGEAQTYMANLMRGNLGTPLKLPDLPGQPEPYDPLLSPVPELWGYIPNEGERRPAVLLMLQCYLQNPCVDQHAIDGAAQTSLGSGSSITEKKRKDDTSGGDSLEGDVPSSPGSNASDSAKKAIYTNGSMENEYISNECVVQMPIAANASSNSTSGGTSTARSDTTGSSLSQSTPPDASVFVTLARGQCRRIIRLDVERVGDWPEIIRPVKTYTDGSLKGRLLRHKIIPLPVTIASDQVQNVFRLHAEYVYGLNRQPTDQEKLSTGVLPFTKYKTTDFPFDPAKAYVDRIGP